MTHSALWRTLPVPALTLSPDDTITATNPAAEDFFNKSGRALTGRPLWQAIAIDEALRGPIARARATASQLLVNDVTIGAGDRPSVLCTLHVAPREDEPETLLFIISPRELAGRQTGLHSPGQAARSAIGMSEMLAHEIKNPLAGITGAAQLLAMSLGPEDQELTDLIVAESRRIVALLNQVEEFGNLSPPGDTPFNIHDVLDRARRSAEVGFGAHMRIETDYDPSLPETRGNADQLMQAVLNLLKNASEAAPGGGIIRIRSFYDPAPRLRRKDGTAPPIPLQIEVIDDGPGLPPDLAGAIFDPFVSGRENGSGLGLALVSKIVTDHGGLVTHDSVPGRTAFRLSLPLADAPAPRTPHPKEP